MDVRAHSQLLKGVFKEFSSRLLYNYNTIHVVWVSLSFWVLVSENSTWDYFSGYLQSPFRFQQVNLFFLLNIVRVLITKLKDTHKAESNLYMKAVRATLILVPLLGIEFVLFPWRPEGQIAEEVYDYVMHILMHYQVGTVNWFLLTWARWQLACEANEGEIVVLFKFLKTFMQYS